jgi:cell division protein FtsB
MSTRQSRNSPLKRAIVPFACLALSLYFGWHAWSGRLGIASLEKAREEGLRLEFELARIETERKALEARVRLLRDGTIERDLLEERMRDTLNLIGPDEIVVFVR